MNFIHITEDTLIELENMETAPITQEEKYYIETTIRLKGIENTLEDVLKKLCNIVSDISNIVTKLNHMDSCILLKQKTINLNLHY